MLLYLTLVSGLIGRTLSSREECAVIVLGVTIVAMAVFLLGSGQKDLFRPIRRPRIFMPVAAASLMLAVLVAALSLSLGELSEIREADNRREFYFWYTMLTAWLFWAVVLYFYTRHSPPIQVIQRLCTVIFAGSIAELLAGIPSHMIVSRRSGCFVGVFTGLGLMAGVLVMIWSFGPAIFLLFLREGRRYQQSGRRPEYLSLNPNLPPIQFSLRTLFLGVLAAAICCSLLQWTWGRWLIAVYTPLGVLLIGTAILRARHSILCLGTLVAVAMLIYLLCMGELWRGAVYLALPTSLLAVLLVKVALREDVPPPRRMESGEE